MNLPNLLSLFRLFITLFFIILASYGRFRLALLLFVAQALSDMLDGFLARRMGMKTALGSYLDPLADKVMLAASYIVLCAKGIIPLWLIILVLSRDLVISIGFLVLLKKGLRRIPVPSLVSKTTTVFQMLTLVYALWSHGTSYEETYKQFFYWTTAFFTVASGCQYVFVGLTVFTKKEAL
jgi:cardiolipin synthase (CMP-forming)